jgi:hypothetical protein
MVSKMIIPALGGLALSFCLATSSFAAQTLSDNQMDKVTAGQGATATRLQRPDLDDLPAGAGARRAGEEGREGNACRLCKHDHPHRAGRGHRTFTARGPTTAPVTANNIAVIATQVGGLSPSSSASVTATLTATAE